MPFLSKNIVKTSAQVYNKQKILHKLYNFIDKNLKLIFIYPIHPPVACMQNDKI